MFPELASFGPLTLHSYGLLIAVGVFLSLFLMARAAQKYGFPPSDKVFDLAFVVVVAGFAGARIFYVIQEWAWYRGHPWEIFQIWKGGLVYYGGVLGSLIGVIAYGRLARLSPLGLLDLAIPYVALTHGFGRLGCFLNGCCYGKVCDLPWAVRFPFLPEPVHPTQIYEAIFNFALFAFLAGRYPRRRFDGEGFANYLMIYGTGRFFLEFLRGDQFPVLFFLTTQQILSFSFLLTGMMLYGICGRKR